MGKTGILLGKGFHRIFREGELFWWLSGRGPERVRMAGVGLSV
jgi:hypothetical protein